MRKFAIKKLVRDNIVDHMIANGDKLNYRVMEPEEFKVELMKKLQEEAQEVATANKGNLSKELADLQELIDIIAKNSGITKDEIAKLQQKKNDKVGEFTKGVYLEDTEIDDSNIERINYFLERSDRNPEIK